MRPAVIVALVVILCSCSEAKEEPKPDSAAPAAATPAAPDSAASAASAAAETNTSMKMLPTRELRCGLKQPAVLRDIGIGALQVGRTTSAVKQECAVVRDAAELSIEGTPERVLTVLVGGNTVRATIVDGIISRISVATPRFATADGLRIGTPLSRLVAEKGVKMAEGEDGLYLLLPSHCGLSFRFSIPSRSRTQREWTPTQLAQLHGRAMVDRIHVTRCVR